jgi:hypothetical protein
VGLLVMTVSFPLGLGQYFAGDLTTHQQVTDLFSNFTWTSANLTADQHSILKHWTTHHSGVFISLSGYIAFTVSLYSLLEQRSFPIKKQNLKLAPKLHTTFFFSYRVDNSYLYN